jgi:hypothetical protein
MADEEEQESEMEWAQVLQRYLPAAILFATRWHHFYPF